jgi:DNA-binding transcriptional MerR regulator
MPRPKKVLNAFTANEVTSITKLSRPMVDYLASQGFLRPAYIDETQGKRKRGRVRGRVRYYSFRDLVIARVVQSLRETGVRLHRLKLAVQRLNAHPDWVDAPGDPAAKIRWLLSDGKQVLIKHQDGFLEEISSGQRAFAFVVNLDQVEREVMKKVPAKRRPYCSLTNTALMLDLSSTKQAISR